MTVEIKEEGLDPVQVLTPYQLQTSLRTGPNRGGKVHEWYGVNKQRGVVRRLSAAALKDPLRGAQRCDLVAEPTHQTIYRQYCAENSPSRDCQGKVTVTFAGRECLRPLHAAN